MTELFVDYRKFERKLKWKEFFSDEEETQCNDWAPDIFPKEKTNLPNKTSKNLNHFITGIKGELRGTEFNKVRPNLPKEEEDALNKLILLQKTQEIIIKPCDKGAGIFICNFDDYKKSAIEHLTSEIKPNSAQFYYKEIGEKDLALAKKEIDIALDSAAAKGELTKDELNAMYTKDKGPGKYYQLFKVHKEHESNCLPPS
jgi:hypothetical protein